MSYGHVGNAAAMFPLQRLGAEVWAVHTVQFSNHTGYGEWTGQVFTGAMIAELMRGISARGVLSRLDAVLSGYLGEPEIGRAILDAVRQGRAANPALLYCCDPVMGDTGRGLFVRPGVPALLRAACVPEADILTPNQFELEQLTAMTCDSDAMLARAIRSLQSVMRPQGPRIVLVTSVNTRSTPPGMIELVAASPDAAWRLRMPELPIAPNGAGDLIAALFLFHSLEGAGLRVALERSGSSTWGVLERTTASGFRELCLISAQDQLVFPSLRFDAEPMTWINV